MRILEQTLSTTTARSQRGQGSGHETKNHEQALKGDVPNKSPINQRFLFYAKNSSRSATR
jgi:hypothetical protein